MFASFAAPGGRLVQGLLVAPDLERIFDYRQKAMRRLFPPGRERLSRRGGARSTEPSSPAR